MVYFCAVVVYHHHHHQCSLNLLLTIFCCNDAVLNVTVDDVQLILITEEI